MEKNMFNDFQIIDLNDLSQKPDDYMNQEMLDLFAHHLSQWRIKLMQSVDQTIAEMQNDEKLYADEIDSANHNEMFFFKLRTRDRERRLIKKIEHSLYQINTSGYGYCENCKVAIGLRRMASRLTATMCYTCKQRQEKIEKIKG